MVPHTSTPDVAALDPPREGPDDLFALVGGLYAALVFAPLAVTAVRPALDSTGSVYIALLAVGTVITVGVALAFRRQPNLPERLGASRRRWILPGLPVAVSGVPFAVFWLLPPVSVSLPLHVASVVGGVAAGLILAMMTSTRYARAAVAEAGTVASWRAGWPPSYRRKARFAAVCCVVTGGLALVVGIVFDAWLIRVFGQVLAPAGAAVVGYGTERGYRVSPAGLETTAPANRHLQSWDQFDGYEVRESAIVIRTRGWWRLPAYCDRSDLDDETAVLDALSQYLDRL